MIKNAAIKMAMSPPTPTPSPMPTFAPVLSTLLLGEAVGVDPPELVAAVPEVVRPVLKVPVPAAVLRSALTKDEYCRAFVIG
jgi:hypothetical protein